MKQVLLPIVIPSLLILLVGFSLLQKPAQIYSAIADHVVISEIQVSGLSLSDEFVELYNPTEGDIDLTGWRITKKTSEGNESNLIARMEGIIPAQGFFLLAHSDYDGLVAKDASYSATTNSISADNTLTLYSDAGSTIVDKVGMGDAVDVEASAAARPPRDKSIERKANSLSTAISLGGDDEKAGNGEDTDDNSVDFVLREDEPDPQNSHSSTEPEVVVSPTPTMVPSPTSTPEPTPTLEASPSPEPTPTLEASPSPEPISRKGFSVQYPNIRLDCAFVYRPITVAFFPFHFPTLVCERVSL
jgi:hypothetical protein